MTAESWDKLESTTSRYKTACGMLFVIVGRNDKGEIKYIKPKGDESFKPDKYCKPWFDAHTWSLSENPTIKANKLLKNHMGIKCPKCGDH